MTKFNRLVMLYLLLILVVCVSAVPAVAAPLQPTPLGKPATAVPQAAEATPVPVQPTATETAPILEATAEATAEAETPVLDEGPYVGLQFSYTEDGAPVLGNPDAPITIIEFADYACPHCQRYEPMMQNFIKDYVSTGRARYEFRTFPTAGGEVTYFVGSVVACFDVQRSGAFWLAHDSLFDLAMNNQYDEEGLQGLAEELDISYDEALDCAASAPRTQVDIDIELGRSLDVNGTPAVRVRYGSGPAQKLVVGGESFDQGGPALGILVQAVEEAETGDVPTLSQT